jgi:hypothetical protein
MAARRPLSAADTAPEPGGAMAVAGSRPSMHARRPPQRTPTAYGVRSGRGPRPGGCPAEGVRRRSCGRSLRTLRQCPRCLRNPGHLPMPSGRRCWPRDGIRVAAEPDAAAASAVRRRCRHRGRVSMLSGRPLSAADTGQGYRNRPPGRHPPECRHCRDTWLSWRASRSPSHARAKAITGRANAKASSSLSHQSGGPRGGRAASSRRPRGRAPAGRPRPCSRYQGVKRAAPRRGQPEHQLAGLAVGVAG